MNTINKTNYHFKDQISVYRGKVREVYNIKNELLVMIATDRISAFDVVLPKQIPFKGQILNQIATKMMEATADIVPNWLLATPDPNVAVGHLCETFKVEMVIRGYLSGHAWREYRSGKRILCGVEMLDGMQENDKFPEPIITPATKAAEGDHDEDISREDIIARGIVSENDYKVLEKYTKALFKRGTEIAASRGLILVDTKYEFGKTKDGKIVLIDEIHTPDSSRYFYAEGYEDRQVRGEVQKQLSKEFVRQWLIANDFQGKEGHERYIELYENITGETFIKSNTSNILDRIDKNVNIFLKEYF
jgi:phosphoribosylaminoimidazole-succinocarboxamide synthase